MKKLHALVIVSFGTLVSTECLGVDSAAEVDYQEAMRSVEEYRKIPPKVLEDPANQEWLNDLRRRALDGSSEFASVLFLNLGEPEVLKKYLEIYRANPGAVGGTFYRTIQPKIIAAVANDFYREEPVSVIWRDHVGDFHTSMWACFITQKIVANSPGFSKRLKQWAKDDPMSQGLGDQVGGRLLRDGMRVWWTENKALFEAERYAEVKPPSTWVPDAAADNKPVQSALPASGSQATTSRASPITAKNDPTTSESRSMPLWGVGIALGLVILAIATIMFRKA